MAIIKVGTHKYKTILHEALYNNNSTNYLTYTKAKKGLVTYMYKQKDQKAYTLTIQIFMIIAGWYNYEDDVIEQN